MSDIDRQWRRPKPGQTTVFLSYHARDFESAIATRAALENAEMSVLLYDPANRWWNLRETTQRLEETS